MQAISIHQPYASLIATGIKKIEHRSWKTKHRGNLLICSTAKKMVEDGMLIPGGYALCVVNLHACKKNKNGYDWYLKNVQEIQPFKVKGKQKLFKIDYKIQLLSEKFEDHLHYFETINI